MTDALAIAGITYGVVAFIWSITGAVFDGYDKSGPERTDMVMRGLGVGVAWLPVLAYRVVGAIVEWYRWRWPSRVTTDRRQPDLGPSKTPRCPACGRGL